MIDFKNISNLYFIGIGGIGMSALARFARFEGKCVAGYDLTETDLTRELSSEGIDIHYTDNVQAIPDAFTPQNTLVVRTPAVPATHAELNHLIEKGFAVVKRSELLGFLTQGKTCLAVAGTHGKTSVSTMIAHLLHSGNQMAGAFLGGISRNFGSNLVLPQSNSQLVVAEADEFDRSFLQLHPAVAVITSIDADHLDIYGTHQAIFDAFEAFINNIEPNGLLVLKAGVEISTTHRPDLQVFTYSVDCEADVCVQNLKIINSHYHFDMITPWGTYNNLEVHYPGRVNVENLVAATVVALHCGCSEEAIRKGLATYKGVQRRFDIRYKSDRVLFIDDYAHHPAELLATIKSVRELYVGKRILGVFQPHLYSRTRDFAAEFAQSLDLLDEAVLLPIYPARELPIEGVTSEMILGFMTNSFKQVVMPDMLISFLEKASFDVLLTMGAGNIDRWSAPICKLLKTKGGNQ
jgi:UDP-N-acetylmuramate--alanine ligase